MADVSVMGTVLVRLVIFHGRIITVFLKEGRNVVSANIQT